MVNLAYVIQSLRSGDGQCFIQVVEPSIFILINLKSMPQLSNLLVSGINDPFQRPFHILHSNELFFYLQSSLVVILFHEKHSK
jgi:hypothetical protein